MNKSKFAIGFASTCLLMFIISIHAGLDNIVWTLFLLSPIIVIYMVYSVIRYGKYTGKELKENEEWGYEDVERENLGTWG